MTSGRGLRLDTGQACAYTEIEKFAMAKRLLFGALSRPPFNRQEMWCGERKKTLPLGPRFCCPVALALQRSHAGASDVVPMPCVLQGSGRHPENNQHHYITFSLKVQAPTAAAAMDGRLPIRSHQASFLEDI